MYFISRNVDYAASLEASLKLKEISYIHSRPHHRRLKHGPISLIEDSTWSSPLPPMRSCSTR